MSLPIQDKHAEVLDLTSQIRAKFTTCDVLLRCDEIDTKSAQVETTSMNIFDNEIGDMIQVGTNYGLPCGADNILDELGIHDTFDNKWDILNELQSGSILDAVIAILTSGLARGALDCAGIESDLDDAIALLDARIAYLNSLQSTLGAFSSLIQTANQVLGTIGALVSCAEELYNSVSPNTSWMGQVNPTYNESFKGVQSGKALYTKPFDIIEHAKGEAVSNLNLDSQLTSVQSDMLDLKNNFPV